MKLSIRIPLQIGIVAVVTYSILGLLSLQISSKTLTQSVVAELQVENAANARLMSTLLGWELGILYEIGNSPLVRTMNWETIQPTLLPEVSRINAQQIALVLPDGSWRSITTGSTTNSSDRKYFRRAIAGEKNIDIVVGRVTGLPVVVMAVPIYQSSEAGTPIIGVLTAEKDSESYIYPVGYRNTC
jgi:hypothetical protein